MTPPTTGYMKENWREVCRSKQARLRESIPEEWIVSPSLYQPIQTHLNVLDLPNTCGLLTARETEITETTDVDAILHMLHTSQWSSLEVTRAFYKRAIVAHQAINCLTEIFVKRALARAEELDDILLKTGKIVGPLHGLPISLKDQFTMKGLEIVMGYAARVGQYSDSDCVLVQVLYDCGAVPFVRTNVPQTLMWGETFNNVFGRTLHPFNRLFTPGGSSGGEGALLAMKGSPLGVGTDIGGSVRIPAAFCGLYSFRPSYSRLPYYGAANSLYGQESICSVLGPMANSLSGLKTFVTAIIGSKPWNLDPLVIRKPWSDGEWNLSEHGGVGAQLCFAIMWDNGLMKPHPPYVRAMKMVKSALESSGHKVIDWEPHRHLEIYSNAERIFASDAGADYKLECNKSGEPVIATMMPSKEEGLPELYEFKMPPPFYRYVVGDSPKHLNAYELWRVHEEKLHLRKSYLDHWTATINRTGTGRPVDAIIAPPAPFTAVPHGLNTDAFYTTICNVLDYPSSVFPVTHVDPDLDASAPPHKFHNYEDEAIYNMYKPEWFSGCPVGLQLIGKTLEDEAVLRLTCIVDEALKKWKSDSQISSLR